MEKKDLIIKLLQDKKANNIVSIQVGRISTIADYFIIADCETDTQTGAISDYIIDELKKDGICLYGIEGRVDNTWVILDYSDIIIHVFIPKYRTYYCLEKIWGDCEIVEY